MKGFALLDRAHRAGVTVRAQGDRLVVEGPASAVGELVPALAAHKAELLALLEGRATSAALAPAEETAIRAWLDAIGETDPEMVQAVLDHCRRDPEALDYFLRRAAAEAGPASDFPIPDDRRTCRECAHLSGQGRCLAAMRGEIAASRSYEPVPDLLRRCERFADAAG